MLGTAAVTMMICPLLAAPFPMSARFLPLYFIVPAGTGAAITSLVVLRRMQGRKEVDPFRERAGVALGTMAIVLPLAVMIWAIWALTDHFRMTFVGGGDI